MNTDPHAKAQRTDRLDDAEARRDRALGVILVGGGIAEVDEQTVAEEPVLSHGAPRPRLLPRHRRGLVAEAAELEHRFRQTSAGGTSQQRRARFPSTV